MATKGVLNGRALGVRLGSSSNDVAAALRERGLAGDHVDKIAATAVALAREETARLQQHLVPQNSWPGTVICRRLANPYVSIWLLLKHVDEGWMLDAALFD
jgi:hypothetical protein